MAGNVGRPVAGGIYAAAGNLSIAVVRNPLLCRTNASGVRSDCADSPLSGPFLQPLPGGQTAHGAVFVRGALDPAAGYVPSAFCIFNRIQSLGFSASQSGLSLALSADCCDDGGSGGRNGVARHPKMAVAAFCSQAVGERSVFLTVRLRRRSELLEALLSTGFLWIFLYGCLLALAAVIPPLLQGFSPDMGLTAAVVGLKLLDIAFQFLIILSVLCVTGQVTAGFTAVLLQHFLCLLPISWLPAGISSLARLKLPQTGGTIPAAAAAVLLAALSLPLILWLSIRGIRRLFNHEGGNI